MSQSLLVAAPCGKCPFRQDVPVYLRADRRREIVQALVDGLSFHCHEHVEWADSDDGEDFVASVGPECAGAAKALLAAGGTTNLMRIGARLGAIDLDKTAERGADVWDLDTWPLVPEGETAATWDPSTAEEPEPCSTSDPGCLAPAGFRALSGAIVRGTESADGWCEMCGEPVCSNCADHRGYCGACADYDEDDE